MNDSHQKINEKSQSKLTYQPLPFGFYLRGLLREATLRDYVMTLLETTVQLVI